MRSSESAERALERSRASRDLGAAARPSRFSVCQALVQARLAQPDLGLTLERYLTLRHVLVAPSGTSGSFVDSELERRGLVRRVALRVSSFLMAPVVVAETDFISTMPELLARRMAKRFALQLVPAPVQIPRFDLSLAWHPRFDDDPAHQWLRGFVTRTSTP